MFNSWADGKAHSFEASSAVACKSRLGPLRGLTGAYKRVSILQLFFLGEEEGEASAGTISSLYMYCCVGGWEEQQ